MYLSLTHSYKNGDQNGAKDFSSHPFSSSEYESPVSHFPPQCSIICTFFPTSSVLVTAYLTSGSRRLASCSRDSSIHFPNRRVKEHSFIVKSGKIGKAKFLKTHFLKFNTFTRRLSGHVLILIKFHYGFGFSYSFNSFFFNFRMTQTYNIGSYHNCN